MAFIASEMTEKCYIKCMNLQDAWYRAHPKPQPSQRILQTWFFGINEVVVELIETKTPTTMTYQVITARYVLGQFRPVPDMCKLFEKKDGYQNKQKAYEYIDKLFVSARKQKSDPDFSL